ncbi:TetR family transcriptional regulator [Pararoseomonas indoligenes]|uniref:TetR family transcriptional regulator n=1 Tax=Roseomonas indoligenes TaxID=2820811 RepID=A0A940MST5_9PROT|nr:TetR family transcriptional regulator [Pararoseomonas indoligenes]MBP0492769.1 TetR family transcriptional regulator [Pararoseomonas indoligenes]
MARSSRAAVAEKREAVLDIAARLFRERGVEAVSVAEVMAAAGLTHGGFYGHFESKEALAAEACARAFGRGEARWTALADDPAGDGLEALLRFYLGPEHRDTPGRGCAAPSFAAEAARDAPNGGVRRAYVAGICGLAGAMERLLPAALRRRRRQRALLALSAMVGAVVIARAAGGDGISDEILKAVREELAG